MNDIKREKRNKVNEKTLIVAIDIAKVKHTGYLRWPDGTETKPFEFFNRRSGFDKLWERISKTKDAHNLEEVVVGFESTGPYAEPLLHYLIKKDVKLTQVNPMHTKRLKELQGNSPNKTDQKDPKVIADIIGLGHGLSVVIPEGSAAELRRLTQARERELDRRTSVFNQLQKLIFVVFPEFLQVMKDVKTKTALYLLSHYPRPEDIVRLGVKSLSEILKKISRGKLGKEGAEALYEAARSSVGIKEGQTSILFEIRRLLSIIEASNGFIAELEKEMRQCLKDIPYSGPMLSIKGIGEIAVAGLIGEVGDFKRFKTIPEIMKLAGLDLFEISSGNCKGRRHITKRGRALIRKLLFFAAINVVRKGGIMHRLYHKYLQRGMLKMKAIIAIARKLFGVIFALVRNHSEYVINYEKTRLKQVA